LIIYVDSTGTINLVFKNFAGADADPSAVDLVIKDSLGATKATLHLDDLLPKDSDGHYHYHHDTGATDATGVWTIECRAEIGDYHETTVITWNVVAAGTLWVSAGEVKQYALVKWDSLNYVTNPPTPFANEYEFDTFLERFLIRRAQKRINSYCRRDFDADYTGSTIPEDIRDVCARVAANMIQILVMNKMGPLIRTGDYKIAMPSQAVLTDEIKADLAPYIKATDPVFYEQTIE
jgi:hypothetical protein